MTEPGIQFTAHPPERHRRSETVSLAGACCCCCCCCLHTLGGVVGGIIGSVASIEKTPQPLDPSFPFPYRLDEEEEEVIFHPALLYWLLLILLIAATAVYYFFAQGGRNPSDLYMGGLLGLMILPGLQLGASLVSALVVALFYADRINALKRVGKITTYSLVGTVIGIVIMGGFCGLIGVFG